jgi:hypothetical protein
VRKIVRNAARVLATRVAAGVLSTLFLIACAVYVAMTSGGWFGYVFSLVLALGAVITAGICFDDDPTRVGWYLRGGIAFCAICLAVGVLNLVTLGWTGAVSGALVLVYILLSERRRRRRRRVSQPR